MAKRKINSLFPQIKVRGLANKAIISIIIFAAAVSIIVYLYKRLTALDYFRIKDVIVSEGKEEEFSYLKGRNIFDIDLIRESRYLSQIHPTYRNVRLIRVLPNRIFVDFIRRNPVAYIKLYRYLCVDDDQAVFDLPVELKAPDLPLILGLETKIFGPKSGKKYNIQELSLALEIIRQFNGNKTLKGYKIKTVDVSNSANAYFRLMIPLGLQDYPKGQAAPLQELIEVKIGQDDIENRMSVLSTLLITAKKDLVNIKYIDLRFKEPVIKFKDAK